jgi:hypothetical protein
MRMHAQTAMIENGVVHPPEAGTVAHAIPRRDVQLWVNCRDPAVIRGGQHHPSKPTNPPARSIVSSVPVTDLLGAGLYGSCGVRAFIGRFE